MDGPEDTRAELTEFVERLGGYLESSGLPLLAARMLSWLLVCEPAHQSAGELATALGSSGGGVSTSARMLTRYGFVERFAVAGDRRHYYRLRRQAFDLTVGERATQMAQLRRLSEDGLALLAGDPPHRGDRLRELHEVAMFMAEDLPRLYRQHRDGKDGDNA